LKNLLYLPIDLPYIIDKEEIYKGFKPNTKFAWWEAEKLCEEVDGRYGRNYIKEKNKKLYPTLCEYIELLPYDAVSNIKINHQKAEVAPHVDLQHQWYSEDLFNNSLENEPAGYRLVIKGSHDVLKIHRNDDIVTAYMPVDQTHAYVLNQSAGLHSVEDDPGRITVYATGFINKDKHNDLLEKSLEKYSQYAVWRDK
tara:strand:- start:431 stop:1021 length:591 start_codon:yes stop_codon:yes gene_type:complete